MRRPRLLDLFCGAGGAAMGYHRAGFDVTGVDIVPRPSYPFRFIRADAMTALASWRLSGFDAIHASPPCDDHSPLANVNPLKGTAWMLPATIERLKAAGLPWVVENVEQAPMPGSLVLCGTEFGLKARQGGRDVWLKRHRRFASSVFLWGAGGCNCYRRPIIGVYGNGARGSKASVRGPGCADAAREVMGIDWMQRRDLDRAIPPAYTEYIGRQLLEHLAG